jgi:carboxylate-amine ligase
LPKGVEIRTPVCSSLPELLATYRVLHQRLEEALARAGYAMVALSHHPIEMVFSGPQNKRRHDYWQWSMEVMTTYGPDINVSLAPELAPGLDLADLEAKINYYGPALSALSVASPFCGGKPWEIRGKIGKSFRMHKRSYIAPPVEFHPSERHRLEFKVFDMPCSLREFEAQILSFLGLVLDTGLPGRATKQTRIYDLGQVARFGLDAECMKERAGLLLDRAPTAIESWGFNSGALEVFRGRLASGRTPADEMLELFHGSGSLEAVLRHRSRFDFR